MRRKPPRSPRFHRPVWTVCAIVLGGTLAVGYALGQSYESSGPYIPVKLALGSSPPDIQVMATADDAPTTSSESPEFEDVSSPADVAPARAETPATNAVEPPSTLRLYCRKKLESEVVAPTPVPNTVEIGRARGASNSLVPAARSSVSTDVTGPSLFFNDNEIRSQAAGAPEDSNSTSPEPTISTGAGMPVNQPTEPATLHLHCHKTLVAATQPPKTEPTPVASSDGLGTASAPPSEPAKGVVEPIPTQVGDSTNSIVPVDCAGCGTGGGLLNPNYSSSSGNPLMGAAGCSNCGGPGCLAGRKTCSPCEGKTVVGRFLCGVYQCVCCPDPCYDPHWMAISDAAFFVDSARPQTQQRIRWDSGFNLIFPDRAEYFWPRADGFGLGPMPKIPFKGEKGVKYNDLSVYTETAASFVSMFVELPYRSLNPDLANRAAGFADMNLGTKSMLFDCELFQVTMQFKTTLPTGNFLKGLGAGHISLDPSILIGMRLAPDTFLQTQVGEWIPFGTPGYSGAILHYSASLNQILYRILPEVPLIGTLEASGWSFQNGSYTDPYLGGYQQGSGETYISVGPGLRLVICDKVDFGIGTAFSVTKNHWAEQLYRSEFRWRF